MDLAKDLYVYSYLNELKEGDTVILKVRRDGETKEIQYTPDVSVRYLLGFNRSDASSMTVESLIAGMPLEMAGLQPGDTITGNQRNGDRRWRSIRCLSQRASTL